ncbi:helix-turn-helix transcriptional regulator [Flavitalea sp. BT771]|uniref:helix-turn-helix transcriptional regulator n=1 Tax=Flavitalea sp. BT771 TaxID=3063329 RepID=UPI0026E11A00|nr:helix-turn-helix transcriptional regulator [Flavitalea sp. BT771]MDO6431384.1 helix-turn-helix transcriptional regulator [Flavitalea sp. BT771]MDV6220292.1 helix-turn-helix transcriptional regulator [Flavitalea sp. BT771]
MTTEIYQPVSLLKDFVKQVVILEDYLPGSEETSLPYFADGLPGIVLQQCDTGMYLNKTKKLSTFFLYGQTVKPIELSMTGGFRIIIFYLYSHVAKVLFRLNSNEITDTCLDLTLLNKFGLKQLIVKLEDSGSSRAQMDLINRFLITHIYGNDLSIDRGLDFAVRRLVESKNPGSLRDIRHQLHISERTFERKFADHVGITPKLFARICQFHASLQQLQRQQFNKLTDIAIDNGYADQSHFIRSFKEFTGLTPSRFSELILKPYRGQ